MQRPRSFGRKAGSACGLAARRLPSFGRKGGGRWPLRESRYHGGVQVAIYTNQDPGGKKLLSTLQRRLKNEEIRAWELQKTSPLTLVHSGDRYAKIRVTFTPAGTPGFSRAAKAGALGAFQNPEPSLVANISDGPSADRVLGFLVGMLTRHAGPLGVSGVGIPLRASGSRS
jgi:hypothetical protein